MTGRPPPPWEGALAALVRDRYSALVARAVLLTGSRAEAHDLVHDALVATFTARAQFTSVGHAAAYVRRAMATRHIDGRRRRQRELRAVRRLAGLPGTTAHEDVSLVLDADLAAAVATLTPRQRVCLLLRNLDDLSVRETAHVLGLSEGAVKRYVADAVAALGERLGVSVDAIGESTDVHLVPQEDRHDA